MTRDEIRAKAIEIYEGSMCGGAGCCGNIEGAISFIFEQIEDIEFAAYERGVANEMMNQWCASS